MGVYVSDEQVFGVRGEWGGVKARSNSLPSPPTPGVARVLILGDGTSPLGSGAL